ncbi:MAG: cytochrome P450 [Candidatus Promineifilaceae bacterium]|nr:cytochrome P450 [Candidatus Promineifilaceae bacterium]
MNEQLINHPPGPKGHWLRGTMREFQGDELLDTLRRYAREYGDAIRYRYFLNFHGYLFSHPEHVEHILLTNNRNYTKMPSPGNAVLKPLVGNGLLTSDGDFWLRQRRLAQPAFHRRRIAGFADTMIAATDAMLEEWMRAADAGRALDVSEEMMRLTLEIAGKTLFSRDLTRDAETVGEAFTEASRQIVDFTTTPFGIYLLKIPFVPSVRRMNRHIGLLDDVVHSLIDERRALRMHGEGADEDLLDMLIDARDEETGEGMSDKQVRDEVMTIMLAGHETTALALSWTFYLLSQHPEVRRRLEAEVDERLDSRTPTFADIPELPYTTMVIEESMRIYPPAYFISRWCNDADVVGGYDVPAGSVISISPFMTHRHPDYWPDAERFDPERFTPEQQAQRPRFAYIPFGGGPRQCIGNRFAMTEAILILAMVSQRFRLELVSGHPVEPEPLITLRPKYGVLMQLERRVADGAARPQAASESPGAGSGEPAA